jgi:hypothetical protein
VTTRRSFIQAAACAASGKPDFSSAAAMMCNALQRARVNAPTAGFGCLLDGSGKP